MIRLLLIDDHVLVRQSIRSLLAKNKEIKIIGEANSGIEGVQLARESVPDVVLLDLKLPDITGLEVTARLLRLAPAPKILALTSAVHHEFPQRILKAGALGYITKDSGQEELIQAIKTVNKAQVFISPLIATQLALAKVDYQSHAIFSQLTNKEVEVLILCLQAVPVDQIAKRLHMSPKTVHSYRYHIFTKLKVHNDIELMTLAVQEGLLALDEVSG